ncbi:hypothetical protein [Zavarzinella formosa]|uniref:hypothetical protein n=1 Tax=Zavarzinella formosa TaxID=360055 RepID=UPI0002F1D146|nr:hypothetical protein [Zavarzinella formosa]
MSADRPDDDREAEDRPRRRDYDDEEEPRRRRRAHDQADDYDDYGGDVAAAAKAKVFPPALILIICAIMCLLMSVGLIPFGIILAMNTPNNDEKILGFVLAGGSVLLIAYYAVMLIGTVRMLKMRSYPMAMTSAIMAIGSFLCLSVTCGVFGVCGSLFMVAFGIWALVVLVNPDVRRQFALNTYRVSDEDAGV